MTGYNKIFLDTSPIVYYLEKNKGRHHRPNCMPIVAAKPYQYSIFFFRQLDILEKLTVQKLNPFPFSLIELLIDVSCPALWLTV